jgi:thymidylate synthase
MYSCKLRTTSIRLCVTTLDDSSARALFAMAVSSFKAACTTFSSSTCVSITCKLTQRSADVGLGLPFNIASYALLTHLLARATGLTATNLILDLGDTHVYTTHEGALLLQLSRRPRAAFPTLAFAPGAPTGLFAIRPEHVDLVDYVSYGPLPMPMAV